MNYLNIFLIFLILLYLIQGLHKGFLISVGNTLGVIVSWIVSFLFSPLLSEAIHESQFYRFLLYFTEGSARIANQAGGNLAVSSLSAGQIGEIVSSASLPFPFRELVEENMTNLAFEQQGYVTVNDYFDYTVANVVVNIFSFLIIYCIARVIISLMINAVHFASPLPVLKRFDSIAGAGAGLLRGYMCMFAVMMVVPVVLVSTPPGVELISEIVAASPIAVFFSENNFLLGFISGVIG